MQEKKLVRKDLIYPELSYQIIGVLFEVYNEIGSGLHEKYYQKATAIGLKNAGLVFKEQVYTTLTFQKSIVGSHFLDFLIDNKVILEIKKGDRFSKNNIEQVINYLKNNKLKLGVIANFGQNQLKFKRIINFDS